MTHQPRIDIDALDNLFAPYDRTDMPGFAVGVALAGKPAYRRGFGMASIELPVPLSPTIRMRIGSTSKHFCVLALMLLQEEGKLSIDASPRTILPELPGWADGMTIRQFMAHTSGMRDSLDLLMLASQPSTPLAPDAQFRFLTQQDGVNFAPGTSWNYNNGGYVLLSLIAERVSGMALGELLRTRIFEPIGMLDTQLRPIDTDLQPNCATLHVPNPAGGWTRGMIGTPVAGEGGIISTVDDMLRWLKHMDAPSVGTRESWAEMRRPHATHGYGLGLTVDTHRGLQTVHHAGGVVGGACQMLKVVDCDLDLIVMTNGRNVLDLYALVDAIIDTCIPGLPPIEDAGGPMIEGTFHSRESGRVLSFAEFGGKLAMAVNGMAIPARRDAAGAISVPIVPTDLRVVPLYEGDSVIGLTATEYGATDRLTRVKVPDEDAAEAITGRYDGASAGLTATISGTAMRVDGPSGSLDYALRALGPNLWEGVAASPLPIWVSLEFDETGFLLTSGRTMRLRFTRTG